jgi:hypothetical protein
VRAPGDCDHLFQLIALATWLQEIAMRLSHAAVVLMSNPEGGDMKLLMTREHYLEVINKWWSTYRGMKPTAIHA